MSVTIQPMLCGWLEVAAAGILKDEPGRFKLPIPSYLIEHPKGRAVFDTGLHRELQTDSSRLGKLARMFTVIFQPGEDLSARLMALNVDPTKVDYVINSHLHFDHVGGNADLPNAKLVVQRKEWEAAANPEQIKRNGYNRADFDLGHQLKLVDGEHDVFGDGSVVCVPTQGHTPGHQSLRVRLATGDVVLAADACYLRRTLETLALPPIVHDPEAMRASLLRLRALRDAGARIFYGHDPEFWASLPQAPEGVV